jgi:hypothetical protein
MPKSLSDQIRECYLRAEESRCWAETASPPSIRDDYLAVERRWLWLARGYEFAERLDSFTAPTSEEPANGGTGTADSGVGRLGVTQAMTGGIHGH